MVGFFSVSFSREVVKAVELVWYISCARSRSKLWDFHFFSGTRVNPSSHGICGCQEQGIIPLFCF